VHPGCRLRRHGGHKQSHTLVCWAAQPTYPGRCLHRLRRPQQQQLLAQGRAKQRSQRAGAPPGCVAKGSGRRPRSRTRPGCWPCWSWPARGRMGQLWTEEWVCHCWRHIPPACPPTRPNACKLARSQNPQPTSIWMHAYSVHVVHANPNTPQHMSAVARPAKIPPPIHHPQAHPQAHSCTIPFTRAHTPGCSDLHQKHTHTKAQAHAGTHACARPPSWHA